MSDKTYPLLPKAVETALIEGPQGSEYRSVSRNYAPGCAMFSIDQMRAYVDADRAEDEALLRQALDALEGVLSVADRNTDESDRASPVLAALRARLGAA
jgi:hypothetical protein